MSPAERVRGFLELSRPVNAVAAGVLTFVGAFVAGATAADVAPTIAGVVATVTATAAGNAINDYFDREIDRINQPSRPIPRGAVTPRGALAFSLVLFALAVAAALTLPLLAIAIAVVNLLALVSYTEVFKGTPGAGNALVAYLGGSTFLFGGAAVGGDLGTAAVLFLLAALATFTREVIKDVEDVEGDAAEGLRTLPLAVGERRALVIGAAVLVVAVLASPYPYLTGSFGLAYLALLVPADLVMLYAAYESFDDPTAGQTHVKWGMFLAATAFVVGRLFA
ncbi:MAG TPA: geranylgeranylglycerol-phosphate geranylgeranyltransferase [Halobacteriales archaeon]|nr:geranylgeranylglycerol-phosphate geranylgeranyltransferase [Halobacteriales archaeon]